MKPFIHIAAITSTIFLSACVAAPQQNQQSSNSAQGNAEVETTQTAREAAHDARSTARDTRNTIYDVKGAINDIKGIFQ